MSTTHNLTFAEAICIINRLGQDDLAVRYIGGAFQWTPDYTNGYLQCAHTGSPTDLTASDFCAEARIYQKQSRRLSPEEGVRWMLDNPGKGLDSPGGKMRWSGDRFERWTEGDIWYLARTFPVEFMLGDEWVDVTDNILIALRGVD